MRNCLLSAGNSANIAVLPVVYINSQTCIPVKGEYMRPVRTRSGRYRVLVSVRVGGKVIHRKITRDSRDESMRDALDTKAKLESGTVCSLKVLKTVGDILKCYRARKPFCWPVNVYDYLFEKIGHSPIPKNRLQEISLRETVEAVISEFSKKEIGEGIYKRNPSIPYVNKMIGLLKTADSWCWQKAYTDKRFLQELKMIPEIRRNRYLTDDEVRSIYNVSIDWLKWYVVTDVCTGAREGELRNIRMDRDVKIIEMDGRIVKVFIACRNRKTKDKREVVRWVPLPTDMFSYVNKMRNSIWLFPRLECGVETYVTKNCLFQAWQRACIKAGVDNAHFHDLRRKFCTDAKASGLSETEVMKLAGHVSKEMFECYQATKDSVIERVINERQFLLGNTRETQKETQNFRSVAV